MYNKLLLTLLLNLVITGAFAQSVTQTVRGRVIDADSKFPLIGVSVVLLANDSSMIKGVTTDESGYYRITDVPLGRQTLKYSYIGYKNVILSNVMVTSGKEVILDVSLEESAMSLESVEVVASRSGEAQNEMAVVSARAFTVEETDRYAGSRGDPARMASNFAGVQGADDSRNDIVIRGNSPQAVLWQLDGVNIPNPNHFNIPGTGGGPVCIINNKMLANSDFHTGAFPAEFGNSIAGVFDLKMRNGNNEKHEFSGMLGFLGTEAFGEGPLSKEKKSSYLFTYRYSTLQLFSFMGIDVGTEALPRYQDASFRLNFPTKNNGNISVFGVGGISNIDIVVSDQNQNDRNIYGENDRDQYFGSNMGVAGVSFSKALGNSAFVKATLAASTEKIHSRHHYIFGTVNSEGFYDIDSLPQILGYTFRQEKYSQVITYYNKLNSRNTLTFGFNNDLYHFHFLDSARRIFLGDPPSLGPFNVRWNTDDFAYLVQPYLQWKHKFDDRLSMVLGWHAQYFTLGNSLSAFEPRAGLNWKFSGNQSLNVGVGLHSQIQPTYTYFYEFEDSQTGVTAAHNRNMGFTRSAQAVLGYDRVIGENMRAKVETYYQYLTNIPVERVSSSFSMVNTGSGFTRIFPDYGLVNEGTGENYGIEFTLERAFRRGYFFLVTASLFESKYKGSDGVKRDTDFNGNYALNGLFTKEFKVRKNNLVGVGANITAAGGRRYGPADLQRSEERQEVIPIDELRNSLQFRPYFRADLRINYRINRPKVSHEIAVDLVNVFNVQNVLKLTWAPDDPFNPDPVNSIREEYQLGFLPLFYYKLDF